MFQPKYTFGYDWAAPREHVSLATVRSIRNMTSRLPSFQRQFVSILDQEFRNALDTNSQVEGDMCENPIPMCSNNFQVGQKCHYGRLYRER